MSDGFADHFSGRARQYSAFRPRYPAALFEALADRCPQRACAWDCATGNGQAAVELAAYFDRVIATDASSAQLQRATAHPKVEYRVATAEQSGLADASVDLVTVAQALHWFDLEGFYAEVGRVARPGALFAAWSYALFRVDPKIDAAVDRFYRDVVGPDWPPRRRHVDEGYAGLAMPFSDEPLPPLDMTQRWNADQVIGYLRTWSASARHEARTGTDPVAGFERELRTLWGPADREVCWRVATKVGRLRSG